MANLLLKISDEELLSKLDAVKSMIHRMRKSDVDTSEIEKELCWLEREREIRDARKKIHQEYTRSVRDEMEVLMREEQEALMDMRAFDNDVPDWLYYS